MIEPKFKVGDLIMTTEQKAKAYDEALEIINDYYQKIRYSSLSSASNDREVLEKAFPVLKENEDERIREAIIDTLNRVDQRIIENNYGIKHKDAIAWLEKQCEKKSLNDIAKEVIKDKDTAISFLKSCGIMNENGELADEYKIEQGEKNPTDKVEPKFKVGDEIKTANEEPLIITKIDDKGYWSEDLFICDFDEECIWNLVEQKPAWSEEDERMYNRVVSFIPQHLTAESYTACITWLKSLKERIQPQNKWKESLATANLENSLCDIQDEFSDTSYEYRILGEAIEFIRCTEQKPQWKPSEEQLRELHCVISGCSFETPIIVELEEQLKKL